MPRLKGSNLHFQSFVVGRGFEPLWTGWKPVILTLRWTDQILIILNINIIWFLCNYNIERLVKISNFLKKFFNKKSPDSFLRFWRFTYILCLCNLYIIASPEYLLSSKPNPQGSPEIEEPNNETICWLCNIIIFLSICYLFV